MTWPLASIEQVTKVVTKGTTPTTLGRPFVDDGIRFIKAEALNGDTHLAQAGIAFIDEETHLLLSRSVLEEGDVLVTIAGAQIGRCGHVEAEHLPANTNQAVGILRVDPRKAVPRFVYYHFKQQRTFDFIQSLGAQAAQPNLNLANLRRLELHLPPLDMQHRIAELLTSYDDLIENNRRRMVLLEEAARLLYREWFIRLRFPGHEHTRITKGMPQGWERKGLAELCESIDYGYTASATDQDIGPKFLRITDIVPASIDWTAVPHCGISDDRLERVRLQTGDIVIARTGATVGYAKRLHKMHPCSPRTW